MPRVVFAWFFCALLPFLLPAGAASDQLSTREALLIGSGDAPQAEGDLWGELSLSTGSIEPETGLTDLDSFYGGGEQPTGGVIGFGGPFGLILDYRADNTRVGGFAYAPNDQVRLEARGELKSGNEDVGGSLTVHFSF